MAVNDRKASFIDVAVRSQELRQGHGISIRALAQKSGLSANALSMIERGKTSPSVSILYKLADALETPITTFFSPSAERRQVVFMKLSEHTHVPLLRGIWEGLGGEHFIGRVEPFIITLETGADSGHQSMLHSGHEFVFLLARTTGVSG